MLIRLGLFVKCCITGDKFPLESCEHTMGEIDLKMAAFRKG